MECLGTRKIVPSHSGIEFIMLSGRGQDPRKERSVGGEKKGAGRVEFCLYAAEFGKKVIYLYPTLGGDEGIGVMIHKEGRGVGTLLRKGLGLQFGWGEREG